MSIAGTGARCGPSATGDRGADLPRLVARDVTARRRAEREREETTALIDHLRRAPVGLAFCDRDLRYRRVNPALARMNGLPRRAHISAPRANCCPASKR
ncbi:MAG: PAS domain-containing protein [Dehalococcoidia bacterium]